MIEGNTRAEQLNAEAAKELAYIESELELLTGRVRALREVLGG